MSSERTPPLQFRCGDCGFDGVLPTHRPRGVCPACGWTEGTEPRRPPDVPEPILAEIRASQAGTDRRLAELRGREPALARRIRDLLEAAASPAPGPPAPNPTEDRIRAENQALRSKLGAAERTLRAAAQIAEQVASLHLEIDRLGTLCLRAREEAAQAQADRDQIEQELGRVVDQFLAVPDGPRADSPEAWEDLQERIRRVSRRVRARPASND